MSEQFKVGEIAIGQNFVDFPEHNGEDLLVIGGLEHVKSFCRKTHKPLQAWAYWVRAVDGDMFCVEPHKLRKKRPPTTGEQSVMVLFKGQPQAVPA